MCWQLCGTPLYLQIGSGSHPITEERTHVLSGYGSLNGTASGEDKVANFKGFNVRLSSTIRPLFALYPGDYLQLKGGPWGHLVLRIMEGLWANSGRFIRVWIGVMSSLLGSRTGNRVYQLYLLWLGNSFPTEIDRSIIIANCGTNFRVSPL